jgi:molecular chaperone IbpA
MRDGQLVIAAKKAEAETPGSVNYLHRGIASRAFEKRFQMADHVRPVGAETKDGLLHIDLVREVPEALKPRRIDIATNGTIDAKLVKKAKKITQEA